MFATRAYPLILAIVISVHAAGCTSISWSGADGKLKHAGLVLLRITPLSSGVLLERWTFGIDLRLNGPDRGLTLGWKNHALYAPLKKHAEVSDGTDGQSYLPDELIQDVLGPALDSPRVKASPEWALFFCSETISRRATYVNADSLGVDIRFGEVSPGLSVLYHGNKQLMGSALEPDNVHVMWNDPENRSIDHVILWSLD